MAQSERRAGPASGNESSFTWQTSVDAGSANLNASVRTYIDRYPWADADAVEMNLALTLTFLSVKDAITDRLQPFGMGLSRGEFNFLSLLHLAEDKQRPLSEIAREMGVTPTYITKMLDTLQAEGLAERVTSSADRRVTYAHLTDEGIKRCESMVPTFLEVMGDIGSALSPEEIQQLRSLLARLREKAESVNSIQD